MGIRAGVRPGGTVPGVQWVMSSLRGVPVSLLVGLPDDCRLVGWFVDDGSERDLTGYVADLLLDGLLVPGGPDAHPDRAVPVADVRLDGAAEADVTVLLVEPAAGVVRQLPSDGLLGLVGAGVAAAVSAAVAAQADEPDGDPPGPGTAAG